MRPENESIVEKPVAIVTGANSGIGFAISEFLVKKGMRVFAGFRNPEDIPRLEAIGCEPFSIDVTNSTDRELIFSQVERLDLLVNNAGIAIVGPVEHTLDSDLRYQMEVNFFSCFAMSRSALPLLRKTHGTIINISSLGGKFAGALMAPYSASKFALEAMTDSLRREVKTHGIKVISICPGPIQTSIWRKTLSRSENQLGQYSIEALEHYEKPMTFMQNFIAQLVKKAGPVDLVVQSVDHALFSKRPKTRYYPGRYTKTQSILLKIIPDSWLDRFL